MKPSPARVAATWLSHQRVADRWLRQAADLDVKYIGVFLDDSDWSKVRRWFLAQSGRKLLPTPPSDQPHMTVKYGPSDVEVRKLDLGGQVALKVTGWAADERGQAVRISPPGFAVGAKHPHITMATAPGVKGVYSNELLQNAGRDADIASVWAKGPTVRGRFGLVTMDDKLLFELP